MDFVTKSLPTARPTFDAPDRAQAVPPAWRVQSVDRAVQLLQAVAGAGGAGSGTVALGLACGLNRATAWRILSTLESHGLVTLDRSRNHWTIGSGLVDIVRTSGIDTALRDTRDVLEGLARQTGETAALAVLRRGSLVYVDEVVPASAVAGQWSGRSISLHATSTGKVLLAWSTDETAAALPRRLERFTDATITDRRTLYEDLSLIRERGYATCSGEFESSAWGVSAPVLDHTGRLLAVLTVWGPRDRVGTEQFPGLGEATMAAARRISGL